MAQVKEGVIAIRSCGARNQRVRCGSPDVGMAIIGMCHEDSARKRIRGERSGVLEGNSQGSEVIVLWHNEVPAPPSFLSCRWCWARVLLEPWIGDSNVRWIERDRSDLQCSRVERSGCGIHERAKTQGHKHC